MGSNDWVYTVALGFIIYELGVIGRALEGIKHILDSMNSTMH